MSLPNSPDLLSRDSQYTQLNGCYESKMEFWCIHFSTYLTHLAIGVFHAAETITEQKGMLFSLKNRTCSVHTITDMGNSTGWKCIFHNYLVKHLSYYKDFCRRRLENINWNWWHIPKLSPNLKKFQHFLNLLTLPQTAEYSRNLEITYSKPFEFCVL